MYTYSLKQLVILNFSPCTKKIAKHILTSFWWLFCGFYYFVIVKIIWQHSFLYIYNVFMQVLQDNSSLFLVFWGVGIKSILVNKVSRWIMTEISCGNRVLGLKLWAGTWRVKFHIDGNVFGVIISSSSTHFFTSFFHIIIDTLNFLHYFLDE